MYVKYLIIIILIYLILNKTSFSKGQDSPTKENINTSVFDKIKQILKPTQSFPSLGNYNISGGQMKALQDVGFSKCVSECRLDDNCVGITYNDNTSECILKTNILEKLIDRTKPLGNKIVSSEQFKYYVKIPNGKNTYKQNINKDYPGGNVVLVNDQAKIENISDKNCSYMCYAFKDSCKGFTYCPQTSTCYIKTNTSVKGLKLQDTENNCSFNELVK